MRQIVHTNAVTMSSR